MRWLAAGVLVITRPQLHLQLHLPVPSCVETCRTSSDQHSTLPTTGKLFGMCMPRSLTCALALPSILLLGSTPAVAELPTRLQILERDSKHSAKELLGSRRRGKVTDLVQKYVGLYKAQHK